MRSCPVVAVCFHSDSPGNIGNIGVLLELGVLTVKLSWSRVVVVFLL